MIRTLIDDMMDDEVNHHVFRQVLEAYGWP